MISKDEFTFLDLVNNITISENVQKTHTRDFEQNNSLNSCIKIPAPV